jgi:hypothetical protein
MGLPDRNRFASPVLSTQHMLNLCGGFSQTVFDEG